MAIPAKFMNPKSPTMRFPLQSLALGISISSFTNATFLFTWHAEGVETYGTTGRLTIELGFGDDAERHDAREAMW